MDFLIKENSTFPILKLKVVDNYDLDIVKFNELMENATVTFSMIDSNSGKYSIANKDGGIFRLKNGGIDNITCNDSNEIIIYYEWTEADTQKCGVYVGEFTINFFDEEGNSNGKLICPIGEALYIHIEKSFGKTTVNGF